MKTKKQKDFGIHGEGKLWVYFLLIGFSLSGKRLGLANSEMNGEEEKKEVAAI